MSSPITFFQRALEFAEKHPALVSSAEDLIKSVLSASSPADVLSAAQRAAQVEAAKRLLKID